MPELLKANQERSQPFAYNVNRVHEVAPWGRSTTYKLVREGRLPARKLGASTFVLATDIEDFISNLDPVVPVQTDSNATQLRFAGQGAS